MAQSLGLYSIFCYFVFMFSIHISHILIMCTVINCIFRLKKKKKFHHIIHDSIVYYTVQNTLCMKLTIIVLFITLELCPESFYWKKWFVIFFKFITPTESNLSDEQSVFADRAKCTPFLFYSVPVLTGNNLSPSLLTCPPRLHRPFWTPSAKSECTVEICKKKKNNVF